MREIFNSRTAACAGTSEKPKAVVRATALDMPKSRRVSTVRVNHTRGGGAIVPQPVAPRLIPNGKAFHLPRPSRWHQEAHPRRASAWGIGKEFLDRQELEGWGTEVLNASLRISKKLSPKCAVYRRETPNICGLSLRVGRLGQLCNKALLLSEASNYSKSAARTSESTCSSRWVR